MQRTGLPGRRMLRRARRAVRRVRHLRVRDGGLPTRRAPRHGLLLAVLNGRRDAARPRAPAAERGGQLQPASGQARQDGVQASARPRHAADDELRRAV